MHNPWKLTSIGLALVVTTALVSSLATAYLFRPAVPADVNPAVSPSADRTVRLTDASAPRPAGRRPAATPTRVARAAAVPVAAVPAGAGVPAAAPVPATATTPAPAAGPVSAAPSRPDLVATVPADCATGGDRAWRIAKPGLIGALLGAGLGAAGGAIADGGDGAGKGALIGGLAGAAIGSGYGAYTTKQECGTILGHQAVGAVR